MTRFFSAAKLLTELVNIVHNGFQAAPHLPNALQLMRMCAEPHDVRALLAACDPTRAKARVPGHALTLKRVFYTPLFPTAHTPPPSLWTGD